MNKPNTHAVAPPSELWDGENAICSYCKGKAQLTAHGEYLYPYRKDYGSRWVCPECENTHVGCHPNTTLPLGRLANATRRTPKKAAHAPFDTPWQTKIH